MKLRRGNRMVLCMMLTLSVMLGMSLTTYAYEGNPYAGLVKTTTTVKFNNMDWYIIADSSKAVNAGKVTLLAKDSIGVSKFGVKSNAYNSSTVKGYLDSLTSSGSFVGVAAAIADTDLTDVSVTDAKLYLLSQTEANTVIKDVLKCSMASGADKNYWWLRSLPPYNSNDHLAMVVNGDKAYTNTYYDIDSKFGVRPALQLDLSSVIFSSVNLSGGKNATLSGGGTNQGYFDVGSTHSAMKEVTYTANNGYIFPEASVYDTTIKGIKVTKTSATELKVSGTPTGVVNITIPDAVHTHDFTYFADGATITAACGNAGCDLTDSKATLTINAPALNTYGGMGSASATLDGLDAFNSATGKNVAVTDIKYVGRDGTTYTESATAPTAEGKYTAKITLSGVKTAEGENKSVTANVDYIVTSYLLWVGGVQVTSANAADTTSHPTWSYAADSNTLTLNGISITTEYNDSGIYYEGTTALNISLSSTNTISGSRYGICTWDQSINISGEGLLESSGSFCGIYLFEDQNDCDFTINGGIITAAGGIIAIKGKVKNAIAGTGWTNMEGTEGQADIAISTEGQLLIYKKVQFPAATVTKAPTANTLTYNGSAQALVTAGAANGGTMQYALGTATEATESYTTSIPARTNAGTYYVWYKVVGDGNHSDTAAICVPVTIQEAPETEPAQESITETPAEAATETTPSQETPAPATATATTDNLPSEQQMEELILGMTNDADVNGSTFYKLQARQKKVTKKAITLTWVRADGASGYTIYGGLCGRKITKLATVSGTSYTQKKLKSGKQYKFIVVATGGGKAVATSKTVYVCTSGGKTGNPVSVSVNKKSVKLKKGKTFRLKVSVNRNKTVKKHRRICYESTDPTVAKVDRNGKIKAVGKGKCYVFVYAQNGMFKRVKVTVK